MHESTLLYEKSVRFASGRSVLSHQRKRVEWAISASDGNYYIGTPIHKEAAYLVILILLPIVKFGIFHCGLWFLKCKCLRAFSASSCFREILTSQYDTSDGMVCVRGPTAGHFQ